MDFTLLMTIMNANHALQPALIALLMLIVVKNAQLALAFYTQVTNQNIAKAAMFCIAQNAHTMLMLAHDAVMALDSMKKVNAKNAILTNAHHAQMIINHATLA